MEPTCVYPIGCVYPGEGCTGPCRDREDPDMELMAQMEEAHAECRDVADE